MVALAAAARRPANERGAGVVLLADSLPYALRRVSDEVVIAPAEGTSFFPSLTATTAVQQGIVATLAGLDPARTRAAMTAAEQGWQDFKLLHHGPSRSASAGDGR